MGVNKLLKAGIKDENEKFAKESAKPIMHDVAVEVQPATVTRISTEEVPKKPKKKETPKKHLGGRPTNMSIGKTSRKQYTLTLIPDDYRKIMDLAGADGVSFSKYIERAVNEYISNHKN